MAKELIIWEEAYSVGIDLIDDQHKKLINMINELYASFSSGEAQEKAPAIVKEMVKYTDYHFKTEEKFFDKFNYPNTVEHKKIHQSFVNKVVELQEGITSGKVNISYEIMDFLRQWFVQHVLVEDKKYSEFLSDKL